MRLDGDPTSEPCPRERCSGHVLYNGHYFCDTCEWAGGDHRWVSRNPRAYRGLMDWRAKRWRVPVEQLTNFDKDLYERGKT